MKISIFLIVLGLTAEIIGLPVLSGILGVPSGWWFWIWHLLAAMLSGLGGATLFFDASSSNRVQGFVFVALVVFCVPFLGGFGLLLGMLLGLRWPRPVEPSYTRADIPGLPNSPLYTSPEPQYGAGGLLNVLLDSLDSDKRVRALMATRQMPPKMAVPILQTGLRDSVDDVRLLAYSMLEQMEQRINDRIRYFRDALLVAPHASQAQVQRSLAQQYWELAYLGLSQGDVLVNVLRQALEYADTALSLMPNDGFMHFLRGRILLRQNQLDEAESAFVTALEAGMAPDDVLPYQAELAFLHRDFNAVSSHLGRIKPLARRNAPLVEIAEYWL